MEEQGHSHPERSCPMGPLIADCNRSMQKGLNGAIFSLMQRYLIGMESSLARRRQVN
jgi:hypothetical protein